MFYLDISISSTYVILTCVSILLIVALVTLAERKVLGSMHRRLGPNSVGVYGILQAFADAIKLLLKEIIIPALSNKVLFLGSPLIALMFSLLSIAPIVFGPGLTIADFFYGILYLLTTYSLSSYGIFFSGWSSNSKYAFLGSLRSTSQLISYELILTSVILMVLLMWGNFNISSIIESQKSVWTLWPLFPAFFIFFKTCIAETNRAPFDLPEAESELVSGFMTEHAASVFVSFFLGEYASIVLICLFIVILFLGGYLMFFKSIFKFIKYITTNTTSSIEFTKYIINKKFYYKNFLVDPIIDGLYSCFILGLKTIILIFVFVWIRATFPRIRFEQLMSYCWIALLPFVVAFIITIPCTLYGLEMIPSNDILFSSYVLILTINNPQQTKTKINVKKIRFYSNNTNNKYTVRFIKVKKSLWTILKEKLSKKSFWFSMLFTIMFALTFRYTLQYLGVNMIEKMSIPSFVVAYTSILVFFRHISDIFFGWMFDELPMQGLCMKNGNGFPENTVATNNVGENNVGTSNPVGNNVGTNNVGENNGQASNNVANDDYWGDPNQLRAGKDNGHMHVNDASNPNYTYTPGTDHQPLLRNIGRALEHQYRVGNCNLTRRMFSPQQENFILLHLLHTNRPIYDKIMANVYTVNQSAKWGNQSNTKEFRKTFR